MTESKEAGKTKTKKWQAEQNWIKDVLSKSGTELVDISKKNNVKIVAIERKNGRKNTKDTNTNNKMVYYPSTPLLIKTEQPSQTQFCLPLPQQHVSHATTATATTTTTSAAAASSSSSSPPPHLETLQTPQQQQLQQQQQQYMQQLQQQQQHQQQQIPITTTTTKQNSIRIKSELYGGSTGAPTKATGNYLPALNNVTSTTTTTMAPATTSAQKSNHNTTTGRSKANSGNKPQFKCEQCGMSFGSKSAHTSHTKSHAKNADLTMGGINSSGVNGMPLSIELNEAGLPLGIPKSPTIKPMPNVAAGGDPYQCNVCQKTFAVPARLIRHYRTHTGERPFECEFCQKLFSVKENLQVHRRIHTKERPYKCDVCGRAFEHSGKLHRHMRIHTGERPHKCTVCEKTFIQSGQLVIHMRTHTGEKPYKCPVEGCGKGFTCSKQLKVHSRTHTGEKPYHCDICFRDFGYNHVLKLHRVQHYGSKCYKCTICDETFKSKKEMEAHIKGHAKDLPEDEEGTGSGDGNNVPAAEAISNSQSSSSTISSTGEVSNPSSPNSPQSPSSSIDKVQKQQQKPRKPRQPRVAKGAVANAAAASSSVVAVAAAPMVSATTQQQQQVQPSSPGSPILTYSPISSSGAISLASNSRHSAASPTYSAISSVASPPMLITHETDHHSRDSGISSAGHHHHLLHQPPPPPPPPSHQISQQLHQLTPLQNSNYNDELPTDLSMQPTSYYQQPTATYVAYQRVSTPPQLSAMPALQQPLHLQHHHNEAPSSPLPHLQAPTATPGPPTINPALLEAASIASRRVEIDDDDDDVQAALQIMELHRGRQQQQHHQQHYQQLSTSTSTSTATSTPTPPPAQQQHHDIHHFQHQQQQVASAPAAPTLLVSDLAANYDDTDEATMLIEHYRRGELALHGLHKGYAPVPKYESSLPNTEIVVRRVEAAIGLRSSTESPERSSSPESDSHLPLRKRKLYMDFEPVTAATTEHHNKQSDTSVQAQTEGNCNKPPSTNTSKSHLQGKKELINGNKNNGNDVLMAAGSSVAVNGNVVGGSNPKIMRMSSVIQFAKAS